MPQGTNLLTLAVWSGWPADSRQSTIGSRGSCIGVCIAIPSRRNFASERREKNSGPSPRSVNRPKNSIRRANSACTLNTSRHFFFAQKLAAPSTPLSANSVIAFGEIDISIICRGCYVTRGSVRNIRGVANKIFSRNGKRDIFEQNLLGFDLSRWF